MSDVLVSLRKLDFPKSVNAAIVQATSFASTKDEGIPGLMTSDELAQEIVAEFILCQKGNKKLSSIEQLVVIDLLLNHFADHSEDPSSYMLFSVLFRVPANELRLKFLAKLLSVGITLKNVALLQLAAMWFQSHGCISEAALFICWELVHDYCMQSSAIGALRSLPTLSSHFACCFLIGVTAVYAQRDCQPPEALLSVVSDWLEADPLLCLVTLHRLTTSTQFGSQGALWTSPTKPNTQTPLPGLVSWCMQALTRDDVHKVTLNATKQPLIWSRLHLAILQTVAAFPQLPAASQLELFTLADMNRLVKEATFANGTNTAAIERASECLLQVLQVSLSTGAFRCSMRDLEEICNQFPASRLLTIIQTRHLVSRKTKMAPL